MLQKSTFIHFFQGRELYNPVLHRISHCVSLSYQMDALRGAIKRNNQRLFMYVRVWSRVRLTQLSQEAQHHSSHVHTQMPGFVLNVRLSCQLMSEEMFHLWNFECDHIYVSLKLLQYTLSISSLHSCFKHNNQWHHLKQQRKSLIFYNVVSPLCNISIIQTV